MKRNDRIEALKRSARYRKDYEEYEAWRDEHGIIEATVLDCFESSLSEEGEKLCRKYGIPYPIHPDKTMIFGVDGEVVGLMEKDMKIPAISIDYARLGKRGKYAHMAVEGQFVTVQLTIDTSQTQKQVEAAFKSLYKCVLTKGSEKKRSPKTSVTYQGKEIDHWLVYDLVEKEGNLSRVMKKIFNLTTNPSYDSQAMARYKQVERYYKAACRLIEKFEGK